MLKFKSYRYKFKIGKKKFLVVSFVSKEYLKKSLNVDKCYGCFSNHNKYPTIYIRKDLSYWDIVETFFHEYLHFIFRGLSEKRVTKIDSDFFNRLYIVLPKVESYEDS